MKNLELKQKAFTSFLTLLRSNVQLLQQTLDDLKESAKHETKSTAGDKHETALAMLQIEQENKRRQLKDAEELLVQFEKINPAIQSPRIVKGSLVKTGKGYFLLSVAAGKIMIDGISIIAVSPQSPLGSKLLDAGAGTTITVNNMEYLIENIS